MVWTLDYGDATLYVAANAGGATRYMNSLRRIGNVHFG